MKPLENKARVCSICNKPFTGYGHNPEPVKPYTQRCCNQCNAGVVVPIRIAKIYRDQMVAVLLKGGAK